MPEQLEPSERPATIYFDRENIRGLFTLGLLAVVATVRIQYLNREITWTINGTPQIITPFFDAMIYLWSFYAFFMVMGLSDDIIGEKTSKIFRRVSRYYLYFSYVLLGLMASVFYYNIYPTQAIGLSVFVVALFIYWSGKQIYLFQKRIRKKELSVKSLSKKAIDYLKSEWYQFLFSIAFVCLTLVVAGTREELIIPSAIVGSIFLVLFLIMKDRKKKTEQVKS